MDQQGQIKPDVAMGECGNLQEDPTATRPVFHQMGNEAISNLERVLAMNSITMQQTYPHTQQPEQQFKPIDLTNGQYNAYLYNSLMQNYPQQAQQPIEFRSDLPQDRKSVV